MDSITILRQFIAEKQAQYPRLSLRSIAAKMEISSGRLSEILNGKRRLSEYYLDKICLALKLSSEDTAVLRKAFIEENSKINSSDEYEQFLNDEQIEKLTDWKVFAFMSFFQTSIYQSLIKTHQTQDLQIQWMAENMNLRPQEISDVFGVMKKAKLIEWTRDRWEPIHSEASTGYDIPNKFIQEAHARDLDLAKEKLVSTEVAKRDFSSITLAIDPKDILKAKKMIRTFRRNFAKTLEKGQKKCVYQISIQFFPLFQEKE